MKVILLEDVKKLGKKGDLIEVADGYARNYLLPRNLAREATEGGIKQLKQEKAALENKKRKERQQAQALAAKLSEMTVTLKVKSGEQGKLFGSVTSKDISEALKEQHDIEVDRRKIELQEPIKSLGNYEVDIKLAPGIDAKLKVKIVEG
ncbi:MAG: 50S ribosomal protein L9 [Tepidanaerobacteraceae bacterium]|nr:50S ribosomal protein L9 [Tepidanaerobacter sp.]HQA60256.1 50S ribosomal protein L9 [Tepidanaerobacteraceae bacterium]HQE04721.1 50S ribosomal protein L9 [Tepidanaerobacteraceae bacterium]